MNLILISSFLIFCVFFFFKLHSTQKKEAEMDAAFWEREHRANFTRKKPLDDLNYITIPEEILHMQPAQTTEEIESCLAELRDLASSQIVNLTGYTNTDLKLEYGTANINILSSFDFHYTNMVTLLQKLAEQLHEQHDDANAITVLEFAVSTNTDVSRSYYLLAKLYQEQGMSERINELVRHAQNINSLSKESIIRNLEQDYL